MSDKETTGDIYEHIQDAVRCIVYQDDHTQDWVMIDEVERLLRHLKEAPAGPANYE